MIIPITLLVIVLIMVLLKNLTARNEVLYWLSVLLGPWSRHFIVLSSARSGSTLLVDLLNNHPEIRCQMELLNPEDIQEKNLENASNRTLLKYIKVSMFDWLGYLKGTSGFKVFNNHLRFTKLRLRDVLMTLNEPKLIILYRKNVLETFLSLEIAKRNNKWYSLTTVNSESIELDWDKFLEYAKEETQDWKNSLQQIKNYKDKFILSYEELCEDNQGHMKNIVDFLGLEEMGWEFVTYSVKQNPKPLVKKVSNYDVIKEKMDTDQEWVTLDIERLLTQN